MTRIHRTTFDCIVAKSKKRTAVFLFNLIKWRHSWTILVVLMSWLFFSNYQVNASLKQYETRLLVALNQHQSECLISVSVDNEMCIANLAVISKLLDEAPMNTSKQALMWEIGRLHLENQWAIKHDYLLLTPRLVDMLNKFYDYNLETSKASLENSVNFSKFLMQEYKRKLEKLNADTK